MDGVSVRRRRDNLHRAVFMGPRGAFEEVTCQRPETPRRESESMAPERLT